MEKKVIDLRNHKGDVTLLLPQNWQWESKGTDEMEITMGNTWDLVPKNYGELCKKHPNVYGEYHINQYSELNIRIKLGCRANEDKNLCATRGDAEAFLALIQLRRLWHEWTKVLGIPKTEGYIIYWDFDDDEMEIDYTECRNSPLFFKEKDHAKKFIECFGELLEKAKILL